MIESDLLLVESDLAGRRVGQAGGWSGGPPSWLHLHALAYFFQRSQICDAAAAVAAVAAVAVGQNIILRLGYYY